MGKSNELILDKNIEDNILEFTPKTCKNKIYHKTNEYLKKMYI